VPAEAIKLLDTVDEMFPQKGANVRHLMNFTNAAMSPDFMEKAKMVGKKHYSIGYKDCYYGVTPLKKVMLNGYLLFAGNASRAKVFDPGQPLEQALDWLAEG